MRISKLCSEVNGGGCKHKVSAHNGFVCAAGHSKSRGNGVARPAVSISKMKKDDRKDLARSTKDETTQLELSRTRDSDVQQALARNPSIGESLQLELFRTGDDNVRFQLARNPSIGRDLALELAKVDQIPYGYTQNKPLAELIQPESLSLLSQYPGPLGQAYLDRLLDYPQEEKEESKALTLHSYFVREKSGRHVRYYKDKILERYKGDQEVALILNAESAQ